MKTALESVLEERERQTRLWGVQSHPDGSHERYREMAELAKRVCDQAAEGGRVTWKHIFYEEVLEALAETDPAKLREELVQACAVGIQWIEAIDRRTETPSDPNGDQGSSALAP